MKRDISYDQQTERPILNECVRFSHDMLCRYWPDIAKVRDECGDKIKIGISLAVDCTGIAPVVTARLKFSKKFEAKGESTIDLAQEVFPFIQEPNL
jgi:hypothetical protein